MLHLCCCCESHACDQTTVITKLTMRSTDSHENIASSLLSLLGHCRSVVIAQAALSQQSQEVPNGRGDAPRTGPVVAPHVPRRLSRGQGTNTCCDRNSTPCFGALAVSLSMLHRSMRCCAPSLQQRSSFLLVRRKSTKSSGPDVMRRLIAARHAAQGFLPTPVDDAVLQDVLEMTRRSPSSFNSQPWSCVIVQDAAQRERLAAAMLGGNTFKVCSSTNLFI
jgi:Nitroreductase family